MKETDVLNVDSDDGLLDVDPDLVVAEARAQRNITIAKASQSSSVQVKRSVTLEARPPVPTPPSSKKAPGKVVPTVSEEITEESTPLKKSATTSSVSAEKKSNPLSLFFFSFFFLYPLLTCVNFNPSSQLCVTQKDVGSLDGVVV
jgi:hypothetical protein